MLGRGARGQLVDPGGQLDEDLGVSGQRGSARRAGLGRPRLRDRGERVSDKLARRGRGVQRRRAPRGRRSVLELAGRVLRQRHPVDRGPVTAVARAQHEQRSGGRQIAVRIDGQLIAERRGDHRRRLGVADVAGERAVRAAGRGTDRADDPHAGVDVTVREGDGVDDVVERQRLAQPLDALAPSRQPLPVEVQAERSPPVGHPVVQQRGRQWLSGHAMPPGVR